MTMAATTTTSSWSFGGGGSGGGSAAAKMPVAGQRAIGTGEPVGAAAALNGANSTQLVADQRGFFDYVKIIME